MSDMPDELLTPLEASKRLDVSTRTVTRWADDGRLPIARTTSGGQRRYDPADVETLRLALTGTDGAA